jgi:hypothetical protein
MLVLGARRILNHHQTIRREEKEPYSEFTDRHIFTKRAVSAEQ